MSIRDSNITSKIMSAIKGKNTKPELAVRKALWGRGYRYRIHYNIIGKPDIVFVSKKIAIFIDGDYWHGHNWKLRGFDSLESELETYSDYWKEKILRNINRDNKVNQDLKASGWQVLRYWESDIKKNLDLIIDNIVKHFS